MRVLIVDDERSARHILKGILARIGALEVTEADGLSAALHELGQHRFDIAFIDLRLRQDSRNRDGLKVLEQAKVSGTARSILVSAVSDMLDVRTAMRMGASDYILKEEICEELILPLIQNIISHHKLAEEVIQLRARAAGTDVPGIVGKSQVIQHLREQIKRIAASDRAVLITGPTGAGKELVVRAIHSLGRAPAEPLLDVNAGAIPEGLIESELFGTRKGAFTDATGRPGYFAAAGRGTLFLDEIAELPMAIQATLLRVLETGRFRQIGSLDDQAFGGRIVAATHANLEARVGQGRFREDLFYRLNVLRISVPPLAEHLEDVPLLVGHFLKTAHRPLRFTQKALDYLCEREWPGNVRQLRNVIDRLLVTTDHEVIEREMLDPIVEASQASAQMANGSLSDHARAILRLPVQKKIRKMVDALVAEAMRGAGDNKSAAARMLGVHRKFIERHTEPVDGGEDLDDDSE